MKKTYTPILSLACAVVMAMAVPAFAQNVSLSGENLQLGSLGVGTAPTGTPGSLSFPATLGVVGDSSGTAATAGTVGENLSATVVTGSSVSLTTATAANITSLSLTPGDWEVTAQCDYNLAGATVSVENCALSGTTGTLSTQPGFTTGNITCGPETIFTETQTFGTTLTGVEGLRAGPVICRVTTAATTVFLVASDTFSAGTVTAFGSIKARRAR